MKRINPQSPPKPCEHFQLIGGTSTGGLIAIMLGVFRMSVDECISKYMELSFDVFQPKRDKANILGRVQDKWSALGKYDSEGLVHHFKAVAAELRGDADALLLQNDASQCRV